jgi:hypothetical protein
MAMAHMTDGQVLAAHDFRPLADPACGLAGPYASAAEARAALRAAGFRLEPWGSGYDGAGRYGSVVVISHPTESEGVPGGGGGRQQPRAVAYAAEVDWPAGDELE